MDYEKKTIKESEKTDVAKEDQQKDLWGSGSWDRESNENTEKKTGKRDKKKDKTKKTKTDKIWKSVAGFTGALLILLGITIGMAGGYLPRMNTEVFLGVVLLLMVVGMSGHILYKKFFEKKQKDVGAEEKTKVRICDMMDRRKLCSRLMK